MTLGQQVLYVCRNYGWTVEQVLALTVSQLRVYCEL